MQCPRCREALIVTDVQHCARCRGAWIANAVVEGRIAETQGRKRAHVTWERETRDSLPCASCGHAMETMLLFQVPVDRCGDHGVWFDAGELDRVVAASQERSAHGRTMLDAVVDLFWLWG